MPLFSARYVCSKNSFCPLLLDSRPTKNVSVSIPRRVNRLVPYLFVSLTLRLILLRHRRIEIFNIYAGIFVDQTNVWKNLLVPSFWVEVSLYCIMIAEMLSVMAVSLMKRDRGGALFSGSAATFGLLINIM